MLLHNGLRELFAKSRFRPVRIATSLTEDLESYLRSVEHCVWLTGVEKCIASTSALVGKVLAANPSVKAIVLAPTHAPEDVVIALRAGASGFLCQDIAGETLLQSIELITHGQMIVHPQLTWNSPRFDDVQADQSNSTSVSNGMPQLARRLLAQSAPAVEADAADENHSSDVPTLSRREMLILRMLMQGASNKVIARNLVITESTVKVHMKAILRKLRLRNRTQAAMWARNNVNDADWNNRTSAGLGLSSH
jgi:two-component system nitrate/nitrite response regulator NarL